MERSPSFDLPALFEGELEGLAGLVRSILGSRAELQEVLQEAFLSAWRALDRGVVPRDPRAWLFTITLNQARDRARRRLTRPPHESLPDDPMDAHSEDPAAKLAGAETVQEAQAAISGLEPPLKEVFLLRVSGDLSFSEIAEALAIPLATAKGRMRRALAEVRRAMGISLDTEGRLRAQGATIE